MCGIFFYYGNEFISKNLLKYFQLSSHRGPDNSIFQKITEINSNKIFVGFHRLAINGIENGNQPFNYKGLYCICNGEIYNYKELADKYNIELTTGSDCEIILPLYSKFGIETLVQLIEGEFAFVIYDSNTNEVIVSRDPLGIRSLYWSQNDNGSFFVASEMKSIPKEMEIVEQFPPGHFCIMNKCLKQYFFLEPLNENKPRYIWTQEITECLEKVCKERLMSERSIGCILSGGLDSTLITAIVSKFYPKNTINTYTIGLEGATDIYFAEMAAEYLGTNQHTFIVTEEEFLNCIEKTIYQIESYDVTTVRASVGNYLLSLKIRELGKDTVIFCGDVSDELFGSYRGFQLTDSSQDFYNENVKMLNNICYFDVLRSDKSISGAGLEARVPYGDIKFTKLIMSIPPEFKMFNEIIMEKQILRDSFKGILPDELLYRRKEAFSDGVSKLERSWYTIITEYVDTVITDKQFEDLKETFTFNKPYDKESLYYRLIFNKYYKGREKSIPYFWKHPFTTEIDPSARKLQNY